MTSPDRLDPLAFCGCFAYLDSDIPPEMTLADWRSRRTGSPGFDSSTSAGALASRNRAVRAGAHPPRGGRGPGPGRKR